MFVDKVRVRARSGSGGRGAVSFRREKFVPLGGPNGGDGGRGGDVVLKADPALATLARFRHRQEFVGDDGGAGSGGNRRGASAEPLEVAVPPGTVATDVATGQRIADLVRPGQRVLIVRGGMGGRGNARFVTSTRQAPRFAERGEPGIERELDLELRVLADVGLVGKPNGGKSTLLAAISGARPKIAPYPFTTLHPELGVVRQGDFEFVVADIPGLIEGAHRGAGLGHEFLRHVERTRLIALVLDVAGTEGRDPLEDMEVVERELALHSKELATRPRLVVGNKVDLPDGLTRWEGLKAELDRRGLPGVAISAATGHGVDELLRLLASSLAQLPSRWGEDDAARESVQVITADDGPGDQVVVEAVPGMEDAFRIRGRSLERLVRMTDVGNPEALDYLLDRFRRKRIPRELTRAGAKVGSVIMVADASFVIGEEGELEPAGNPVG